MIVVGIDSLLRLVKVLLVRLHQMLLLRRQLRNSRLLHLLLDLLMLLLEDNHLLLLLFSKLLSLRRKRLSLHRFLLRMILVGLLLVVGLNVHGLLLLLLLLSLLRLWRRRHCRGDLGLALLMSLCWSCGRLARRRVAGPGGAGRGLVGLAVVAGCARGLGLLNHEATGLFRCGSGWLGF